MVLAFMVMWDLPNIQRGVASLETSRLSGVYREVAPTFGVFGTLFGKALQAQVMTLHPSAHELHDGTDHRFSANQHCLLGSPACVVICHLPHPNGKL
jgi:hypothetical protein